VAGIVVSAPIGTGHGGNSHSSDSLSFIDFIPAERDLSRYSVRCATVTPNSRLTSSRSSPRISRISASALCLAENLRALRSITSEDNPKTPVTSANPLTKPLPPSLIRTSPRLSFLFTLIRCPRKLYTNSVLNWPRRRYLGALPGKTRPRKNLGHKPDKGLGITVTQVFQRALYSDR